MKQIILHGEKVTQVDDEDFHRLNNSKWHITSNGYAQRSEYVGTINGKIKVRTIKLHRELMAVPEGVDIDHADGNKLNNQKSNLRIATRSQNMMNKIKRTGLTSKYKGVHWHKGAQKWNAKVFTKGVTTHLGYFNSEEAAALAYNEAASKIFGEFAVLNILNKRTGVN